MMTIVLIIFWKYNDNNIDEKWRKWPIWRKPIEADILTMKYAYWRQWKYYYCSIVLTHVVRPLIQKLLLLLFGLCVITDSNDLCEEVLLMKLLIEWLLKWY